jgi:serine/threonine protein kinase
MGVVYRARHRTLHSEAAVKVLDPSIAGSTGARERFLREARITASLRHECVVRVYHVGESERVLFLVMELLDGESLSTRLRREPPLTITEAACIGCQVAGALAEAHQLGLVHRDIKPGNIFLVNRAGRQPQAKVLDFGIARHHDMADDLTMSNQIVGTPQYMAPEQTDDSHVGPAADIFSLGCVLYELAVGRNPFLARSAAATLRKLAEYGPPPLSNARPDVPDDYSELVNVCLNKDPNARPSAELVAARLAAVESSAITAKPAKLLVPAGTTIAHTPTRNNRRRPLAAYALTGLLLVAFGVGTWRLGKKPQDEPANAPTSAPAATTSLSEGNAFELIGADWGEDTAPPFIPRLNWC